MDKSWIAKSRLSKEFFDGVEIFAFEKASPHDLILCPCYKCVNALRHAREVVREHLVCNGFLSGYTCWVFHGEHPPHSSSNLFSNVDVSSYVQEESHNQRKIGVDDINSLLQDAFGFYHQVPCNQSPSESVGSFDNDDVSPSVGTPNPTFDADVVGSSNAETMKFFKCLKDANEELYPRCTKFSKLSFIVHLFHLKCINGMTGKAD